MALDITFSGPAQLDIDYAEAPALEVDLLPEHRLGQHVDFDDSVQLAGYVITRNSSGGFEMQSVFGGMLTIGASPHPSPSDGYVWIDTDQSVFYTYESTRGHWLGEAVPYHFGWRGSFGGTWGRTAGNVTANGGVNYEGYYLSRDMVLVGFEYSSDSAPGSAGSNFSIKRDGTEITTIPCHSGTNGDRSSGHDLDIDFDAGGTLAVRPEDLGGSLGQDMVLTLWFRRKRA